MDKPPTKKLRHAEKSRSSTCAFADSVAAASMRAYEERIPVSWRVADGKQTCVACIVALRRERFFVVGLGVGTKFPSRKLRDEDPGGVIRDCHAEVLARRSFKKHIALELLGDPSVPEDAHVINLETGRLRDDVSLHFYSSSSPCGNSVIRKWASARKEKFQSDLKEWGMPSREHPAFFAQGLREGQCAALVKSDAEGDDFTCGAKSAVPPGTKCVSSDRGTLLTCSDKILLWNVLGLQGGILRSMLTERILLASITVGRKFCEPHCRRAFCCRAEGFKYTKKIKSLLGEERTYALNHPSIMGTSLKLDKGAVDCASSFGKQATFRKDAWAWWPALHSAEHIDGSTGRILSTGAESQLSRRNMLRACGKDGTFKAEFINENYAKVKKMIIGELCKYKVL